MWYLVPSGAQAVHSFRIWKKVKFMSGGEVNKNFLFQ